MTGVARSLSADGTGAGPGAGAPARPAGAPRFVRARSRTPAFQVAPLVDVLLILLIFFLTTSTYLDLDMIPMAGTEDAPAETQAAAEAAPLTSTGAAAAPGTMLLRLDAQGRIRWRGQVLTPDALAATIRAAAQAGAAPRVLALPSAAAPAQALVDLLGAAARGGARSVDLVRIAPEDAETRP